MLKLLESQMQKNTKLILEDENLQTPLFLTECIP